MTTTAERKAYLLDLGLTETEIEYITTPFAKLNHEQRHLAMAIWDKRNTLMVVANDKWRAEQAVKLAEAEGAEEVELDDEPSMTPADILNQHTDAVIAREEAMLARNAG